MTVKEIKEIERTKVKPCPFCGGEAKIRYINDLRYHHIMVCCSKCWCAIKETLGHYERYDIEKTIKKWNTRVTESERKKDCSNCAKSWTDDCPRDKCWDNDYSEFIEESER